VINRKKHSDKKPAKQAAEEVIAEPNKIGAATPYDFEARNLTAYGGLLPVATMLEKLGFPQLLEETLTVKRITRAMPMCQFVLAMVLAVYIGFSRLHHLRFLEREPMLTGILKVLRLPPQCTFWRFLASLHLGVARQLLEVQRRMRERVWDAAHVQLSRVTLDTDTTVHTLFGNQMGGRKSYNPKNKGKKSYQPILTFLAETREYIGGELRNGDRPTGAQIARHLESVFATLPPQVKTIQARADSGFYCGEAVEAYQNRGVQFIVSARKTSRLVDELKAADWKQSPRTDADGQCESLSTGGLGENIPVHRRALREEAHAEGSRRAGAVPVVRYARVQLSRVRDQHEGVGRSAGVVLQPAGRSGESDQGSQQRRWFGGASVGSLDDELQPFSVGDAGLQPQLLANAVQSRGTSQSGNAEAYHAGDGAPAISVPGSQNLAACRKSRRQLQRPLR